MMSNIFNVSVNNRIDITSNVDFDNELTTIVYDKYNNEINRANFLFKKNLIYWLKIDKYRDFKIKIYDNNNVIFEYDVNDDFTYVTCGDIGYMDLIEKLVISLNNVSNKKIIVYGINCIVPFDYPNLIKRQIITDVKSSYDKWFWKQQSCLESLYEFYGNHVWIDGDTIANYNIDNVSHFFPHIENYPLCDIHIHDEQLITKDGQIIQRMCQNLSEYYNIPRKVLRKDLHACFYVYNKDCEWFFKEMLDTYRNIRDNNLYDPLLIWWNDECLHNFMMSKYNFNKALPLSNLSLLCQHDKYNSNPEVLDKFYKYWIESSPNDFGNPGGWSYVPENKNQVLYFHENKNLNDADKMISFIKMIKNDNFYNSKNIFYEKYKISNFETDERFIKNNDYSIYEYDSLLNVKQGDVVVDIGSDIGVFERYCYLKNADKVFCVEKDSNKRCILEINKNTKTVIVENDINNLFESGKLEFIDILKINDKGNEFFILNNINKKYLSKIRGFSIKWYNYKDTYYDILCSIINPDDFDFYIDKKTDDVSMIYIIKKKLNREPSISIFFATIGKDSLTRILDSVIYQLSENDRIYVAVDGKQYHEKVKNMLSGYNVHLILEDDNLGHWGHGLRNKYQYKLEGDYILHADDDDIYLENSIKNIKENIKKYYGEMLLFRSKIVALNRTVWDHLKLELANISTACGAIPNVPDKMGTWEYRYGGDFDFYNSCKFKYRYINEVIYVNM